MQFSALFSYMLWDIELKFCIWLWFNVLQIRFKCRYFASFSTWLCFNVLQSKFVVIFAIIFEGVVPLSIRPSSDGTYYGMVISVRPGLRPLVFRTFLLHALTFWAEIMHVTLFKCTTDQVTLRQFLKELCLFVNLNIGNVQFSALFSYMLWHIGLKFFILLCFNVLRIKFECRHFA